MRKGEKGTPILYVEYTSREVEKDARGKPVVVDGHKQYTETQRDRPMVKIHTVFNVEQTEGLTLPPVGNREAPAWDANTRVEGLVRHEEVRVDHVQGDQAYYHRAQDRVVLPDRSQFPTATGYSHTALHELGHATGHERPERNPDVPAFVTGAPPLLCRWRGTAKGEALPSVCIPAGRLPGPRADRTRHRWAR